MIDIVGRKATMPLLALLMIFVALGCEPPPVEILQHPEDSALLVAQDNHIQTARDALADGDFAACASAFALAAQNGSDKDAAFSLFEASRCSARAGDFRTSLFQLSGAASAGYYNLADLQSDSLLRPLHGNGRWQMVVDMVTLNQRNRPATENTSRACALLRRLRSASKVASPRRDRRSTILDPTLTGQ